MLAVETSPVRRRILARATMTVIAWLAAFAVVMVLLSLFGDELGSLPLAVRALLISGVLVVLMANVVMPVVAGAVGRWLGTPIPERPEP